MTAPRPTTLKQLRDSGWQPKTVKQELRDNFLTALKADETLFPGIVGYEDTVIPEISIAVLAGHDMLFLGEKGQAKSRLMRSLVRFLDEYVPYLDIPGLAGSRGPVQADHAGRQGTRREHERGQSPHRLVAAKRALRGAARAGHQVRRRDRRDRPREARGRHEHVGRGRPALRPHPADASRHLRDERNPRARRTDSGRPVQHPRRARRADSRLPDPVRSRRARALLGQPDDVQPLAARSFRS